MCDLMKELSTSFFTERSSEWLLIRSLQSDVLLRLAEHQTVIAFFQLLEGAFYLLKTGKV